MLYGKNVVIGVSGGIACYKMCEVVSALKKLGAGVDVIMTSHACEFVTPLTFQTLAKSAVVINEFEPVKVWDISHISLAKKADLILIAPATANIIAKLAKGIADDMLTTTYLASKAVKLICPAMNEAMYDNVATKENLDILKSRGALVLGPNSGLLACNDIGKGRMSEPQEIVDEIVRLLTPSQDYHEKRVIVTVGGTEEPIDGVRVLSNRSSGKMGMAIVEELASRGATVTAIVGNISVKMPTCIAKSVYVKTTKEMRDACFSELEGADVVIMAAAVADYRPKEKYKNKLKADELVLHLEKNPDIAASIGEVKGDKKLVVFAAETEDILENAKQKLEKKHADMVVANDVSLLDAGFEKDLNRAFLIDKRGEVLDAGKIEKRALAKIIADKVLTL